MAKKDAKPKSTKAKKKGSAKKPAGAARAARAEEALSVLEGEMKSVIRTAFLNRGQ